MKNKRMAYSVPCFIIAWIIICQIGCGKSQNEFIGKWELEYFLRATKVDETIPKKEIMLEINKDKSLVFYFIHANKHVSGNWISMGDGRIKITVTDDRTEKKDEWIANIHNKKLELMSRTNTDEMILTKAN